jgi:cephalosporin-C deacetylase-like acetyl esterase
VKSRPEWNGKTLIVTGGSMGGGQSIAAAALDPQVTLVVAGVPAIGDHGGNLAKVPRRPGWPQFYTAKTVKPEVKKAVSYYDNIFFARRVKCEVYLTTGLIDRTCPPTSVYLYFKNLKSAKKDLDVFPCGDHAGGPTTKGNKRIKEVLAGK